MVGVGLILTVRGACGAVDVVAAAVAAAVAVAPVDDPSSDS